MPIRSRRGVSPSSTKFESLCDTWGAIRPTLRLVRRLGADIRQTLLVTGGAAGQRCSSMRSGRGRSELYRLSKSIHLTREYFRRRPFPRYGLEICSRIGPFSAGAEHLSDIKGRISTGVNRTRTFALALRFFRFMRFVRYCHGVFLASEGNHASGRYAAFGAGFTGTQKPARRCP